jgi:hypothetical protein
MNIRKTLKPKPTIKTTEENISPLRLSIGEVPRIKVKGAPPTLEEHLTPVVRCRTKRVKNQP